MGTPSFYTYIQLALYIIHSDPSYVTAGAGAALCS